MTEIAAKEGTAKELGVQQVTRAKRSAVFGWVLFDWAQQPVFTLITTFLFAPYFANVFVGEPIYGQALWGYATSIAGIIVAIISPLMGAMADATGRRKPWIFFFSVLLVLGSMTLWIAEPGAHHLVWPVITAFIVVTVAVESQMVFINAMMPSLVPSSQLGRLSGIGWAVGYVGGLVSLIVMAGFIVTDPNSGETLLGMSPALSMDAATREADRLVGPFSAIWFIVFAVPFFVLTPDGKGAPNASVSDGLANLVKTFSHAWAYRNILTFLLARMFYIDGLMAIFAFGGIYGAAIFNWQAIELGLFGIILTLAGTLGAIAGGYLDDLLGPKPVISGALCLLILATIGIVSVDVTHILFFREVIGPTPNDGLFVSTSEQFYLLLACVVGIVAGPIQTASRSFMARLAPADHMTQFFGLFAFSGKVTLFLAPLVVGLITHWTYSQRAGIAAIIVFLFLGLVIMTRVHASEPST